MLYNDVSATDGRNNLPYKGDYTLTIEANGFRKFSKSFTVAEGKEPAKQTAVTYDAISRATGSTSSGGSSSDSSGGYAISTDFLFDSDLVANANVLDKLNKSTADSTAVLEYWKYSASTLDSAFNKGDTKYFSGTDYTDYVSTDRNGKLWKSYADFRSSHEASVFPPHATKAVLEDGLLGDIQDSAVSGKLDYVEPSVSENEQGKDVVLTFANGEDYLGKISALYLNGDWRELDEKYYSIEGNTITLSKDLLHVGENALKIVSAGYKTQTVTFTYSKVNEENLSLSAEVNKDAKTVTLTVNGSNGDFLKNLTSVKLGDDAVYGQGVEGSDAVYYEIAENNKSLTLHNVKPGSYQLTLSAEYYEDLTAKFTMGGEVAVKAVPTMKITSAVKDGVCQIDFEAQDNTGDVNTWKYAVNAITVNKATYEEAGLLSSPKSDDTKYKWDNTSHWILTLGGGAFQDGNNTVVISADGYENKEITVVKEATGSTEPTKPTTPTEPGESEVKVPTELPTITKGSNAYCTLTFSNAEKWLAQNLTVTVNDVKYDKTGSIYNLDNGGAYYIEENNISLKIPYEMFDAKTSTLVISDGTSTINFAVTMPGSFSFGAEPTIAFTK